MRSPSYFTDPIIHRCFKGNEKEITSCVFVPSMRQTISGSQDGSIFVWGFKPQQRPFKFVGHKAEVGEIAVDREGKLIASASLDETVRLWTNSVKGKCEVLKCHPAPTRTVDFSATGKFLLTGSNDKTLKLFSLSPKFKFLASFTGHTNWVRSGRFSPDSRLLASASNDHTVKVFDVESKTNIITFLDHLSCVSSVRFSPDGTIVASAGEDGKVKVFDIRSRRLIQHYDAHSDKVNCIEFHVNGNHLISCSDDSTIKIWDLKMGQILYTVHGHKGKVKYVSFSSEGDYFCSGGEDSILMVWKSNISHMDEEFNTLGLPQTLSTKISNKTKFENYEKRKNDERPVRYKVSVEKGAEGLLRSEEELKASNENATVTNMIKNASMVNNLNTFSGTNQVLGESTNSQNKSSYSMSPDLANSFDTMLNQLELITKTMAIMETRIQRVEGQVEELFRNRTFNKSNEKNEETNNEKNPPVGIFEDVSEHKDELNEENNKE